MNCVSVERKKIVRQTLCLEFIDITRVNLQPRRAESECTGNSLPYL